MMPYAENALATRRAGKRAPLRGFLRGMRYEVWYLPLTCSLPFLLPSLAKLTIYSNQYQALEQPMTPRSLTPNGTWYY